MDARKEPEALETAAPGAQEGGWEDAHRGDEFLRLITDRLPVRVGYVDPQMRYAFLNGEYERAFGFAPGEAWGRTVEEIVGTEAWKTAEPHLRRAMAGETHTQELSIRYPFGERRILATYVADPGPDGRVRGVVVQATDVTERYQAERTLAREREDVFSSLDAAEVGVWMIDLKTGLVYSSPGLRSLLGLSEDVPTWAPVEIYLGAIHEEEREGVRQDLLRAAAEGGEFHSEFRVRSGNGREHWVLSRGTTTWGEDGTPLRSIGAIIDISDRRRQDERRRADEERYRAVFDSIDEGFCIVEMLFDAAGDAADFRYVEVNPAFERITGMSAVTALSGRTVRQIVPGFEDFWIETYGRVVRTGEPESVTREAKSLNRWYEVRAARLGDEASARVAIVFNDITARKRDEESLRRSEARNAAILASTSQIVWTRDEAGDFIDPQTTWSAFTGQTFEELRGARLAVGRPPRRSRAGVGDLGRRPRDARSV